jgi:hypothetical protein
MVLLMAQKTGEGGIEGGLVSVGIETTVSRDAGKVAERWGGRKRLQISCETFFSLF